MTTYFGTCHFVSRRALVAYYKSQDHDIKSIQQKLDEGLCFVGRPVVEKGDIVVMNDEGRYLIEEDPHVKLRGVKLRFKDPKYNYVTEINGTRKEICKYFSVPLNLAPMGSGYDDMQTPDAITFLDDGGHYTFDLR